MRNKIVKVLWIDDECEARAIDAKNIMHKRKDVRIEVLHPIDKKLKDRLLKIENGINLPDIFLIDYFLDQKPINGDRYDARALTLAGKIRELVPEYPIYVITEKVDKKEGIEGVYFSGAQAAKATFDEIITFKDVQRQGHDILYYDALDFKLIRNSQRENLESLFKLLKAPEGIKERLKLVLPDELQQGLTSSKGSKNHLGNTITFARWVLDSLLNIPGFIYDELHASTYLGMNIKFFNKVSPKFKRAKYSGVFARTSPYLWWVAELNNILFSTPRAQKSEKTYPWEVAQIVFQIPNKGLSKCAVCGGFFPETVGINFNDEKDLKPVHYKCSRPHPTKRRTLYFDELRTFEI